MRVDHGRADVTMTEKLLDGPYVVAIFEQVSGERMTQGMAGGRLRETGGLDRGLRRWT
jgi:hypothetical protein